MAVQNKMLGYSDTAKRVKDLRPTARTSVWLYLPALGRSNRVRAKQARPKVEMRRLKSLSHGLTI
jgi:hypothetical protein